MSENMINKVLFYIVLKVKVTHTKKMSLTYLILNAVMH